jgi:hypothetical protein
LKCRQANATHVSEATTRVECCPHYSGVANATLDRKNVVRTFSFQPQVVLSTYTRANAQAFFFRINISLAHLFLRAVYLRDSFPNRLVLFDLDASTRHTKVVSIGLGAFDVSPVLLHDPPHGFIRFRESLSNFLSPLLSRGIPSRARSRGEIDDLRLLRYLPRENEEAMYK